jgi:hypothetical protein
LILGFDLYSQFREKQEDPRVQLMRSGDSSENLFLDMSKLSIDHTLQMSYSGSNSYSLIENEYIAGLNYKFSNPLTLRVELGASYVPYSSFNMDDSMRSDIYLRSATLSYQPYDDMSISLNYRNFKGFNNYSRTLPFERENKFGNYFINEDGE